MYLQKCGHNFNKEQEELGKRNNVDVVESFVRNVNKCSKWTDKKEQEIGWWHKHEKGEGKTLVGSDIESNLTFQPMVC